ncbi:hypothetical protein [Imhoffiella purpurea]|uniref:Putative rhizosphere induced protein n=1 Tax=Imhoffiella purpurea TaxID=1249627 RepID=W9V5C3_9GAMM|nr:hypothetical protein [Imhoffiella purpurea]EXJ14534.1 putative rhizosphere induced protein [Imhoffiella purpurea]
MLRLRLYLPLLLAAAVSFDALSEGNEQVAVGTNPVTTGAMIRGITLQGPAGASGTSTGRTCDFSKEEVDQAGRLTDASINCKPGGTTQQVLVGLPGRFNAYCVIVSGGVKSGRVIQAPVGDDANHCLLSGVTIKDATQQFGGAVWR